jgi:hypothetical protein
MGMSEVVPDMMGSVVVREKPLQLSRHHIDSGRA